jgi:hypothetical protein
VREFEMSDLGDIFNMFSDEGNSKPRKQTASQDESSDIDPKSVIMKKLARNKPLLIATVVAGIAIICVVAFFLIKYIGVSGANGIIDGIKPFLN